MSKKINKILMLIAFFMVICFSQISSVRAYELSWHAGDVFSYKITTSSYTKNTDVLTGYYEETNFLNQQVVTINITGINLLSKLFTYVYTSGMISNTITSDFGWNDFTNDLQIGDLFDVDYEWNYGTNSTILVSYSTVLVTYFVLEPEWKLINDYFKEELNGSTIIETVADPYEPIIHNITLNDFLNDITSFTLNGKGTLTEGLNQLTDTTSHWIMEVNCNNKLYEDYYNGTLGYDVYIPYTQFLFNLELEYDAGGLLKKASYCVHYEITEDNITTKYDAGTSYIFVDTIAGRTNFAYIAILPAIMTVLAIAKIRKNKKELLIK